MSKIVKTFEQYVSDDNYLVIKKSSNRYFSSEQLDTILLQNEILSKSHYTNFFIITELSEKDTEEAIYIIDNIREDLKVTYVADTYNDAEHFIESYWEEREASSKKD